MKIIVGLGNPGEKYEKTRHNVGFMVLDKLLTQSSWKKSKSGLLFYSWLGSKAELIKPQTYMNRSGEAVVYTIKKHKLGGDKVCIIHDDIDLPLGTVKVSFGGGSAGHRGVESIISTLGSKDFWRVRIGILSRPKDKINTEKFVLQKFTKNELEIIEKVVEKTVAEISNRLKEGFRVTKFSV